MSLNIEVSQNQKICVFLDYQDSDAESGMSSFSVENSYAFRNLSIETLMNEIKPVIMEEKLESREDSKLEHFSNFRLSEFRLKGRKKYFWNQSSSTSVQIPMETFLEKIKPVDTQKYEIEDRDNSEILAFFGFAGISTLWAKGENDWLFNGLLMHNVKASNCDPEGRAQFRKYREESLNLGLNQY